MNAETIGLMAGAVWAALNETEAVDAKQLKKMAKAKNDRELFAALGWLAREGKVVFIPGEDPKELMIQLAPGN